MISFGANIGDPLETIRAAAEFLQPITSEQKSDFRISRFFRTPPVGGPTGQPPFVNAVAAIETPLDVWEIWAAVRRAETAFGRQRNVRWEARKLDVDILLHDDSRIWTPRLKVPHPRMCMRRFILAPACDVAAEWTDPVSGLSIGELSQRLAVGPGNLRVLAAEGTLGLKVAAEAARRAGASFQVISPPGHHLCSNASGAAGCLEDSVNLTASHGRRIEVLPLSESPSRELTTGMLSEIGADSLNPTKLSVFLGGRTSTEGAWEDLHREAAIGLGMKSSDPPADWRIQGAKYLLTSEDENWAIHELTAALEAMDCPVEPISE
ncbi:MAG: 2-amino-4-hydroxy-6-hydroxymethyldihydropteridine diphosphokinase [Pirellulaceae bacterium]